jgi:N-acetylglutamate synthase-like GNAT family acetyltransferase
MKIRKAIARDSLLLSSLCVDVQRLHAENHPEIFKMPQSDDFAVSFFEEILADSTTRIYIAEEKQRAIGYIFCKLFERPEGPFTCANLRSVAQRNGVGMALMKQAEELARELGVKKIQLSSWDFNTQAHTFFERHGFAKIEHRFLRYL